MKLANKTAVQHPTLVLGAKGTLFLLPGRKLMCEHFGGKRCIQYLMPGALSSRMDENVCIEVLVITVFLWASIWGLLDMLADRLGGEGRRAAFCGCLLLISAVLLHYTPGLTTCRVI